MQLIIKIFPEVLLKSRSVRKLMTRHLQRNCQRLLSAISQGIQVRAYWDRLEIDVPDDLGESVGDQVGEALLRTPGIDKVLEIQQYPFTDMDDIATQAILHYEKKLADKTFAVRCNRRGQHDFTSIEVERFVGAQVLQAIDSCTVKLKQPDVTVAIDIVDDKVNIIHSRKQGLGGFPMGSQSACLSLVSGGFDSSVASYHLMRRGLLVHNLFFNLGGSAHETGVKQVSWFLWNKYSSTHKTRFITVPFEGVVAEILDTVDDGYMGIVLKRMMLRAADEIAGYLKLDALVTGESIAQVSSQTLRNLALIDKVSDKLIIRPLATTDKTQIMALANTIGVREFAENMPEYCGVVSKKPNIHGKFTVVEEMESAFDMSVLQSAIDNRVMIGTDTIIDNINDSPPCEVIHDPGDYQIIDIRRPDEANSRPLSEDLNALQIPFTLINHRFSDLEAGKHYLLYCDKGVMSQLHAQYLRDEGFHNVAVYRPAVKSSS